ncbi:MAG: PSD1 and planctomycete cytochrome C domain-containing protein [Lentisphaeraceae bacterium]|nr:PSD1 and planctomycete cytochrome C domain-containing protein [Lentisphaeraceae bacterium]
MKFLKHFLTLPYLLWSFSAMAADIPDKVEFNRDIRPIFSSTCFNCHGPDAHEMKGKLQLHTFEAATKKLGKKKDRQAIVPGKPELSIAWKRIATDDEDDVMPPVDFHHSLTERDKLLVKKWIKQGAEYQSHWAYEPIAKLSSQNASETIDKLVRSKLQEIGLKQNKIDSKLVLIRRLSLDLRGLLPSQEEVSAFLNDKSENAWENIVDKFLNSPAYGEKMASHWFDLVRYSNSVGFHGDQELRNYPYRDYVIKAFNMNMPFDQFTREQLAGDLLENPSEDQIIATAYNRLNKVTKEGGAQAGEYLAKYAADRVSNLSSVWLGSTLECAECHDHKYDPFSAEDFYSMAAFFADVKQVGVYGGGNNQVFAPELVILPPEKKEKLSELETTLKKTTKKSKEYKALAKEISALKKEAKICVITETTKPMETRILPRGNWMDKSGKIVQPKVPHFMKQIEKEGRANRLDLANWLCSEDNPLAARAFVNRLWAMYFGKGVSEVTEDLGSQGELPVNLELVDFLARQFMDNKWDIQKLIKTIVMSETYKLATERNPQMIAKDPYNRYQARQSIIRLNAEVIRDTALQVSGLLDKTMGGRNVMPYQPAGYYSSMNFNPFKYRPETDENQYRRAVYIHWQRTFLHPFLKNFDAPEREVGICSRTASNTPLQALTLLNDPTFVEAAKMFAQRIILDGGQSVQERLNWAYNEAFGRNIASAETAALNNLLTSQQSFYKNNKSDAQKLLLVGNKKVDQKIPADQLAAWTQVARTIMNLHEFIVRR